MLLGLPEYRLARRIGEPRVNAVRYADGARVRATGADGDLALSDGGGFIRAGLDYAGCRAAVAGARLKWREVFDGLTVMEAEVLRVSAENRE